VRSKLQRSKGGVGGLAISINAAKCMKKEGKGNARIMPTMIRPHENYKFPLCRFNWCCSGCGESYPSYSLSSLATCCHRYRYSEQHMQIACANIAMAKAAALWFIRHNYMQIGQIVRPTCNLMRFCCKSRQRTAIAPHLPPPLHFIAYHPIPSNPQLMANWLSVNTQINGL